MSPEIKSLQLIFNIFTMLVHDVEYMMWYTIDQSLEYNSINIIQIFIFNFATYLKDLSLAFKPLLMILHTFSWGLIWSNTADQSMTWPNYLKTIPKSIWQIVCGCFSSGKSNLGHRFSLQMTMNGFLAILENL